MSSVAPKLAVSQPQVYARWLPLLLVWGVIGLVYADTARAMVAIWSRSDTFAHAFLVPPITVWLIWRQRAVLAAIEARPNAWFLLPMTLVGALWLLGDLSAANSVTQFAFTALIVLAVPAVLGTRIAKAILFPLGFLFFAVPFGEFLMPQLMEGTANFTVAALQMTGVPVFREGLHFVIPSGSWSVVEACSGVRYLIASVMVGTLFAYLNYRSLRKRLIFVGVAILVPIVANWFRAYLIVMLGHYSNNALAAGVDHLIYGWVFFGIVIVVMFMIGARWSDPDAPASAAPLAVVPRAGWQAARIVPVTLGVCLLIALPHVLLWNLMRQESAAGRPQLGLPETLSASWSAQQAGGLDWKPGFINPSAEINRTYASGDQQVGVYVGYYRQQNYERKLVSSENVLVGSNDAQWARVWTGSREVQFDESAPSTAVKTSVHSAILRNKHLPEHAAAGRLLAWQVYWVHGTLTASGARARLLGAMHRLLGHGDDGAVLIFYTPNTPADQAPQRLQAFVNANFPLIDRALTATRDRRADVAQPRSAASGAAL